MTTSQETCGVANCSARARFHVWPAFGDQDAPQRHAFACSTHLARVVGHYADEGAERKAVVKVLG